MSAGADWQQWDDQAARHIFRVVLDVRTVARVHEALTGSRVRRSRRWCT